MNDERDDSPRPDEEQHDDSADTAILPNRRSDEADPPPKPVPAEQDEETLIEHLPAEDDPSNEETRIDLRRNPPLEDTDTGAEAEDPPEEMEAVSPAAEIWSEYAPDSDNDITAALAAVASLGTAEDTFDEYDADVEDVEDVEDYAAPADDMFDAVDTREERIVTRPKTAPTLTPGIALPPMRKLKRGSMASIIPALALIGTGAWLLFVTTTGGTIDPLLLVGIGVAAVALSLFAYWISSGRWSRGALFAAALVALTAGLFIVALPPPNLQINAGITPLNAYPLLIAAVGIALLIGGAFSRPSTRAAVAPGIVLLTAGIIGFLVTSGAISQSLLDTAAPLWFVPIVILVIVWLLPLIARMRGRD